MAGLVAVKDYYLTDFYLIDGLSLGPGYFGGDPLTNTFGQLMVNSTHKTFFWHKWFLSSDGQPR